MVQVQPEASPRQRVTHLYPTPTFQMCLAIQTSHKVSNPLSSLFVVSMTVIGFKRARINNNLNESGYTHTIANNLTLTCIFPHLNLKLKKKKKKNLSLDRAILRNRFLESLRHFTMIVYHFYS